MRNGGANQYSTDPLELARLDIWLGKSHGSHPLIMALESNILMSRETSASSSYVLVAVLRMDIKDSEVAARRDINAFMAFMALLRMQVNREMYPSLLGESEGEGESIRHAFTDVRDAIRCAFDLRHAAQRPTETVDGFYSCRSRPAHRRQQGIQLRMRWRTRARRGRGETLLLRRYAYP